VKELADEKCKIKKKYASLVFELKKMMDEAEKRVVHDNLPQGKDSNATVEKELGEKERNKLKYEVDMLKHMQKSQVEIMKVGHKKWNDETWTLITCSMK
jgi:hypothetical protein